MGLLTRFLGRSSDKRSRFDWDTLDASELARHPGLMQRIFDRQIDGVTVTNVYTAEEAATAVRALEAFDGPEKMSIPFGWVIGPSLGATPTTDRSGYMDAIDRANEIYRDAFGFDPFARITDVLRPVSSGRPLLAASEGGRDYNPAQVRSFSPGCGGLPAHVGNEFRSQLAETAMSHLITTTQVTGHISYFVMLQPAEKAGELVIYDLYWEDNQGHTDYGDIDDVGFPDDSWIESVPSRRVPLGPGDMVLFTGGYRWHRVDPPEGNRERVTYGGFSSPSLDGTEIHFWA